MAVVVITGALLNAPVQAAAPKKWGKLTITQGPTTVTLAVEIAGTPSSFEQGLGLRESLPETSRMLFDFGPHLWTDFWMRDVLIPLSVAFIEYDTRTQQWKIAEIVDMVMAPAPHDRPLRGYHAAKPFRYALQVNQGFFQRHNFTVGARVQGTSGVALIPPPVQPAVTIEQGTLTITQGPTTVTLAVGIADTPLSREQGLGDPASLPETSGVLFVYDTIRLDDFWMRDTLIPLSLAFIGYDTGTPQWEIAEIVDTVMAPDPHDRLTRGYHAVKPYRYVLEVNQGFFQRHNLTVGARVQGTSGVALIPPVQPAVTTKRGTLTITQGPTTVTLAVDIADTPMSRARGLGLRESLPETSGMWFDYETLGFRDLWMTDVLIPLSVAFIADHAGAYSHRPQWEIAEIVDMDVAPYPHSDFRAYRAAKPFRYALEVNQGFFERHGLTVGAKVQFTPP